MFRAFIPWRSWGSDFGVAKFRPPSRAGLGGVESAVEASGSWVYGFRACGLGFVKCKGKLRRHTLLPSQSSLNASDQLYRPEVEGSTPAIGKLRLKALSSSKGWGLNQLTNPILTPPPKERNPKPCTLKPETVRAALLPRRLLWRRKSFSNPPEPRLVVPLKRRGNLGSKSGEGTSGFGVPVWCLGLDPKPSDLCLT